LVANILKELGVIKPSLKLNAIYPSHFMHFHDSILNPTQISKTIKIIF
jgi:hypothetical protein